MINFGAVTVVRASLTKHPTGLNHPVKSLPDETFASPPAQEALRVIGRLREAGYFAVLAGGCVRDALLGRIPKDFDVATEATPDSVREVFGKRNTLAFGASFGVIGVLPPKAKKGVADQLPSSPDIADSPENAKDKLLPTEVATFRADGNYSDGRRPDSVTYGNAEADALRRDFTINGMFYDPVSAKVLDYVGGLDDLQSKQLRTIGEASRRFDEDKLRMLRAVRFMVTLQLTMEADTMSAIQEHADSLSVVSGERIGAEMRRVMVQADAPRGLELLVEIGLADQVWPVLKEATWTRLKAAFEKMPTRSFEIAMATTLLVVHSSHAQAVKDLTQLTKRWKLSVAEQRAIASALTHAPSILSCEAIPWSELQPILIDRDIEAIMGTAASLAETEQSNGLSRARKDLQLEPAKLNPPPLLTGTDLMQAGYSSGPHFRLWLMQLRQLQLDGEIRDRDDAFKWVQSQPEV